MTLGLLMIVLVVAAGEVAAGIQGSAARWSVYAGGGGGFLAALSGLPFLLKIAGMEDAQSAAFWSYWGFGLLTRTLVGLLAAAVLLKVLPEHSVAGVLALAAVYFVALMVETVWLAKRVSRAIVGK